MIRMSAAQPLSLTRLTGLIASGLLLLLLSLPSPALACGANGGSTNCNENDAGSTPSSGPDRGAQNPIDLITGNKYQREIDHQPSQGNLSTSLAFVRHYNSYNHRLNQHLGPSWRSTWQVSVGQSAEDEYQLIQSDGRRIVFSLSANEGDRQRFDAVNPSDGHLLVTTEGIHWQLNDSRKLDFNPQGQLTQINHPGGYSQNLSYTGSRLTRVEDNRGQHLNLHYYTKPGLRDYDSTIPQAEQDRIDAEASAATGQLKSLERTDGSRIHYHYDGLGNLKQVTYPDHRKRTYHYENEQYPHALTGISDTKGKRIASWGYDDNGRANHHHKAKGVDRIDLVYTLPTEVGGIGSTELTNSLNQQSAYTWQHYRHDSQPLLLSSEGPGCSHCPETNVQYEYTDQHQIKAIHRKSGTTHYVYDELGRTIRITQNAPTGESYLIVRYEYDVQGCTNAAGAGCAGAAETEQQTRPNAIIRPSVNPAGEHRVEIEYDAQQQPTQITERGYRPTPENGYAPISQTTKLAYENGNLTTIDGPREDVKDLIQLRYDDHRHLTSLTGPDGIPLTVKAHDDFGRPTQIQRGSQSPTTISYNESGQIKQISQYDQSVTYTYTDQGQLKSLTGPNGDTLTIGYDAANRAIGLSGPDGSQVQDILDSEGQLSERQLIGLNGRLIQSISHLYDAQGRLQSTSRNGQLSQQYDYDEQGRVTQITDGQGHNSHINYGPLGQLQSLIAPDQSQINLSYDDKGQAIALTDPRQNTTEQIKDDFGNVVQHSHPDTGTQRFTYDTAGNRIEKQDAEGRTTIYRYDAANRLIKEHSEDGVTTTLSYDPNHGQLKAIVNADSTETFTYTQEGRLQSHTRVIDGHSFTTRYAYNERQQLSQKTLPDGQILNYHYYTEADGYPRQTDKLRAITKETLLGLSQETIIGEIDHDKTDGTTGHTYANGIRTEYHWDEHGQLAQITNNQALELIYTYDDYGQISGIDLNGQRQTYLYDERGRLVTANTLLGQFKYGYDKLGNRTAKQTTDNQGNITTETYTYPEEGQGNRLLAVQKNGVTETFNYNTTGSPVEVEGYAVHGRTNAAGEGSAGAANEAASPTQTDGLSYEYNQQQRPVKVYKDDNGEKQLIAEYTYNRFGERIKKITYDVQGCTNAAGAGCTGAANRFGERIKKAVYSSTTKRPKITYYLYDGHTLTAEANEQGNITAQYVYHKGHQPISKLEQKQVYAIHSDHMGTPRIATNEQQQTVWNADYTPFGKAEITQQTITLNLRLPGQYEDTETGTYYNYFRDYNPETGRYQTSDPIGLKGGLNTYAYVSGNPLSLMDPLGLLQNPAPGTALYRALVEAGLIAAADGPEPGPADAAGASYLLGAIVGITLDYVISYLDRPDQADIDYLYNEIRLYKPSYTGSIARTWNNHEQLVLDLFIAHTDYVNSYTPGVCTADSNNNLDLELLQRAENALAIRDALNTALNSPQAYLSPEGIYFPNETIYRAERFAYELYLEKGRDLSFEEWYTSVRATGTIRRTAESVNEEFIANDWNAPYKPGTQVTEYTLTSDEQFVRMHFGPNEKGDWIMKKEAVYGLTPAEIKIKYSLKHEPTLVSDVTVPAGARIRKGRVNTNFEGNSGATQYQLLGDGADKATFVNKRPISEL